LGSAGIINDAFGRHNFDESKQSFFESEHSDYVKTIQEPRQIDSNAQWKSQYCMSNETETDLKLAI